MAAKWLKKKLRGLCCSVGTSYTRPTSKATSDYTLESAMSGRQRLKWRLARRGLKAIDVGGKGDCLFRSLADIVLGDKELHGMVRRAACEEIASNMGEYAPFIVDHDSIRHYLYDMGQQGTWADHVIIQAAANALGVIIHITESKPSEVVQPDQYLPPRNPRKTRTVHIAHLGEFHYQSTRPLGVHPV